jgi:hypothetical protein
VDDRGYIRICVVSDVSSGGGSIVGLQAVITKGGSATKTVGATVL